MTGEMSCADVTREAFPAHFAIADALGGTVHPFDVYQGPYVLARGHRLWISDDGNGAVVYDETTRRQSERFPECFAEEFAPSAAESLIEGGGIDPKDEAMADDAARLADIGEA